VLVASIVARGHYRPGTGRQRWSSLIKILASLIIYYSLIKCLKSLTVKTTIFWHVNVLHNTLNLVTIRGQLVKFLY
jgi:hypothetical protein